jgi:hypothetical protein
VFARFWREGGREREGGEGGRDFLGKKKKKLKYKIENKKIGDGFI